MIPELRAALAEREAASLYRRRRVIERTEGARVVVDGRECVAFCSNDYLGLASHPGIAQVLSDAARTLGSGAGSAHLVSGHHPAHQALEEALAQFTGRDRALLFSTGYMANLGIGTAFAGRGRWILQDRLNHASLLDAATGSGARLRRYAHADAGAARVVLEATDPPPALLMTDGVFSMDGDLAPVAELATLCTGHGIPLVVDDAHGLGVMGANGGGLLAEVGLDQDAVPMLMGTLGKAFGVFGAFVAGPEAVIETLIQRARTYIYTTALPPALAVATLESLRVMQAEPWRRARVHTLVARFRAGAAARGIPLMKSQTPIQPVPIGDAAAALAVAAKLEDLGFLVTPIRPPTVPQGTARLRVTLSAAHEDAEVDALLDALSEACWA